MSSAALFKVHQPSQYRTQLKNNVFTSRVIKKYFFAYRKLWVLQFMSFVVVFDIEFRFFF